jgi:acyl-CoA thioester hydrolase
MPAEFHLTRSVAFSETDLAGVMHFANYLRWVEDVEHAFWRALGLSVHFTDQDGITSWPRVAASCEYLTPLRFDDMVDLCLRVERIGKRSLTLTVDFTRDGTRVACARTTAVCCRTVGGAFTPIDIPPHIHARLKAFQGE